MKRIIFSLIFSVFVVCMPLSLKAQMVNYKILQDNPSDVNNFWLYLDLAQMDIGFKNIDGASFNLGVWSTANYKKNLGGDFIFRYGWLTLGKMAGTGVEGEKLKNHMQFELGGFYLLSSSTRQSNTNVILSRTTSGNVTTTRSLMVPATKMAAYGVRGGFMTMGGVYGTGDLESSSFNFPSRIKYHMTGIYAGLLSTKTHNIIINTDTDGKALKCKRSRFYLDAMVLPISSAKLNDVDYKPMIDPGIFGFRFGWQAMPSEVKKVKGVDVKTTGSSFGVEAGVRPFDGIFITGTWSICLMRRKMPALGYELPASERNTSE